ncbi:hypothetical protein COLO4_27208 [Corchorus olitorius]|uniref:Uncharacterized protein n=1 Tax=Corchorus olitorius TaxID=93759 RepID=A0A1R3HSC4_9ROSI|nr:hypothetical protein COLO4_27208 [Corchorus olitorius]
MKNQADKHQSDKEFAVGDMVFLRLQPYRQPLLADRQNQKLSPRYYGPYRVLERVGKVAYKLALPTTSQIHHVFHVSQLKLKLGNKHCLGSQLLVHSASMGLEPLAILDRRTVKRQNRAVTQLLVHWKGSFPEDSTWEFAYDLQKKYPHFDNSATP